MLSFATGGCKNIDVISGTLSTSLKGERHVDTGHGGEQPRAACSFLLKLLAGDKANWSRIYFRYLVRKGVTFLNISSFLRV